MLKKIASTIFCLLFMGAAVPSPAQTEADMGAHGNANTAVPTSDSVKSVNGFRGMLVVTTDANWKQTLQDSSAPVLNFGLVGTIKRGVTVTAFVLAGNPEVDGSGKANVRVSYIVTDPKGQRSEDKNLECIAGPLESGKAANLRVCQAVLTFVGDDNDATGLWEVDADVTDANSSNRIVLRSNFRLE